jgi:hypothetical protein
MKTWISTALGTLWGAPAYARDKVRLSQFDLRMKSHFSTMLIEMCTGI